MPVEDHTTHPSTVADPDGRHGCWNKPRALDGYYAPQRIFKEDGSFTIESRLIRIHPDISRECRYDESLKSPRCEGCQYRGSGEAYVQRVIEASQKGAIRKNVLVFDDAPHKEM